MTRLQIAQRIHQLMLREIGHAIEIERLLTEPHYARDVLLVCDAVPGAELVPLAALFRLAQLAPAGASSAPGHAQQPTEWSRDTSGFGLTHPPLVDPLAGSRRAGNVDGDGDAGPERRRGWLPHWRGKPTP